MPTDADSRPSDLDKTIGQNVRRFRERAGLSQAELAVHLNRAGATSFHQTTVARVEKGERSLRAAEMVALAQIFETSMDQLAESRDTASVRSELRYLSNAERNFSEAAHELIRARRSAFATLDEHYPLSDVGDQPDDFWLRTDTELSLGELLYERVEEYDLVRRSRAMYAQELASGAKYDTYRLRDLRDWMDAEARAEE
ncbi:helix-turn-helix domain-containing protein [Microbacterium enclense]|uniref:helix-turn-helix domain-containing protein n=1 Tax=Microbacterium enclense TaxID=993073 RepID=UPI00341C2392